ncbi:MAG: hypothetical protein GY884_18275 [Proteobacteria bacterium]|nr:hypothetical protein [Pseudomonadota bacterium]
MGRWKRPRGAWMELPWLIDPALATQTLWEPIRAQVLDHFERDHIAWHEEDSGWYGHAGGPSPNLMDSQIFCLNFWFGVDLAAALKPHFPDLVAIEAIEPEWIGRQNHLGERGSKRRRGKYATSADLLVRFRDCGGDLHGVLIESKWTESYSTKSIRYSSYGTDRATIYAPSYGADWSPFAGGAPEDHMVDPFDQLMRLCLLAAAMEHTQEDELETVTVMDCCPRANTALWEPLQAADFGQHLRRRRRFRLVAYEDLFAAGGAPGWSEYMTSRYGI